MKVIFFYIAFQDAPCVWRFPDYGALSREAGQVLFYKSTEMLSAGHVSRPTGSVFSPDRRKWARSRRSGTGPVLAALTAISARHGALLCQNAGAVGCPSRRGARLLGEEQQVIPALLHVLMPLKAALPLL